MTALLYAHHQWGDEAREKETKATCEETGSYEAVIYCEVCHEELSRQARTEEALGHDWGEWTITKEPTEKEEGEKTRQCWRDPSHIERETIPRLTPEPDPDPTPGDDPDPTPGGDPDPTPAPGEDPDRMGDDGTPAGHGASFIAVDQAITAADAEEDPAGTRYAPLMLKSVRQTKKAISLKWKKQTDAVTYAVYGSACGSHFQRLATLEENRFSVKKIEKKLKKAIYYRFIVVALDRDDLVVSTSKAAYVSTRGNLKKANPAAVIVKAKISRTGQPLHKFRKTRAITLKEAQTTRLKAKIKPPKKSRVRKYRAICYESADPAIVQVTDKGVVKAVAAGRAKINVYSQSGVCRSVTVTVK